MKTIKIEYCPNPQVFVLHANFTMSNYPELELLCPIREGIEPSLTPFFMDRYALQFEVGAAFDTKVIAEDMKDFILKTVNG
jgi:hypothetical protein